MRLFILRYGKFSEEQIEKCAKRAVAADDGEEKLYLKKCREKARSNQLTWKHRSLEAMKVSNVSFESVDIDTSIGLRADFD